MKPNVIQKEIFVKVIKHVGFIKQGELNTGFFGWSQKSRIQQTLQLDNIYVVTIDQFRRISAERFETATIEAWQ